MKYAFVALPKKPAAIDCENHSTISHVTKILMLIILKRKESKIKPATWDQQ